MRSVSTLALLMLGASLSLAQDPTGTWKGKLNIKFPAAPANMTPEQKAQIDKAREQIAKAVIVLVIKKDKTFSLDAKTPMAGPGGNKSKGKWSQKGSTITMVTEGQKMPNGQTPPPQDATLSKDGKTLTITIPNGMGSVVFKK